MPAIRMGVMAFGILIMTLVQVRGELIGVGDFSDPELSTINTATGVSSLVGNLGLFSQVNALAIDGSGVLYSVADDELITINSTTGAASLVAALDFGTNSTFFPLGVTVRGMSFSPTGELFVTQSGTVNGSFAAYLYTVDTTTGDETLVGDTNLGGAQLLAFGPDGTLYGWDGSGFSGGNRGLVTYNTTTGAFTDVSMANGSFGLNLQALAYADDGNFYAATQDDLYQMDVTTGVVTLIGSGGGLSDLRGLAGASLSAIPEPSGFILLMGAFGLLGYRQSRKES